MSSDTEEGDTCSICLDLLTKPDAYEIYCGHSFHKECLDKLKQNGFDTCPICRAKLAVAAVIKNDNDVINEIRHVSEAERDEERRLIHLALAIINRDNTITHRALCVILLGAKGRQDLSIDDLLVMFDDDRPAAKRRVASPPPSGNVSPDASPDASFQPPPPPPHMASFPPPPPPMAFLPPPPPHVDSFQSIYPPVASNNARRGTTRGTTRGTRIVTKPKPGKRDPKNAWIVANRFKNTHNKNKSGGKTKKNGQRTHRRKKNTSRSLYTIK